MKNRSIYLSISILLIIISVILFTIDSSSQTISRENITSTSVKSEVIEHGIELEKELKEGKSFTTTIDLPITNINAIDDYMRNWSNEKEDELFSEVEQISTTLSKNAEAQIVITPIVQKIEKNLLTYEVHSQYIVEDPSLEEEILHSDVETFTFNLKNEQLVTLDQVLSLPDSKEDSKFTNLVNSITNENIKTTLLELYNEDIQQIQWMLTKQGLIFLLQNEENEQQIDRHLIKFKELEPILTDSYKKQFIKTEKKKKAKAKNKKNKKKLIALTFDDGPDPDVTPQILKTLKKHEAKATFFMLVNSAEKYPKIAKQVANNGHEIANHTYTHVNLAKVKRSRIEKELAHAKEKLESITERPVKLFRPPYGEYNQAVVEVAHNSEQHIIMWSVDPQDWRHKNKNKIYQNIMQNSNPGSIVLMHDIHQATADALPKILKDLKEQGYEFVTVSELLKEIEAAPNGVYYGK